MKVRVTWEFDADVEDYNPRYVNVPELAKELTKNELASRILNGDVTIDDFEYSVVI